jgi:L-alanine-DL-glutamate epimerase-like enolase superfamily enzyme
MKITAIRAHWLSVPIPEAQQHTSDFIVEYSLGANPMLHELAVERFPVVDGYLEIPDRPGLGVTIDPDFVAKYRVAA